MVYLYLLFLVIALWAESNAKKKYFWRVLIPLVYSALVGFRGMDVGIDTHAYFESYYAGGEEGLGFVEPGFDWVNTHLFKWGYDANFSFFVYALLTNLFFFLTLEETSKIKIGYTIPAFCLYFLTYTQMINGMRQDLACAIFLYSLFIIKKGKPLIYLVLILFGALFHASVLFMIPVYFIRKMNPTPKFFIALYLVSFIGVISDISSYIPAVELFNRDYGKYLDRELEDASWLGFFVTSLLNFITLLFIVNTRLYKEHKELSILSLFYLIFINLGFHMPIISRVGAYFWWFTYLLFGIIWDNRKNYKRILYSYGIILLLFLNMAFVGNNVAKGNYQYYFYWETRPTNFIHKYT